MRYTLLFAGLLAFYSAFASASNDTGELAAKRYLYSQVNLGLLVGVGNSGKRNFSRADFGYKSYKPTSSTGFYTQKTCRFINIDHIVSLKDAYDSGADSWSAFKKSEFANDRSNHVPSCGRVNYAKGSAVPKHFLRRSTDGKGLEYQIVRFCEYVQKYHSVKVEYGLSFNGNSRVIFARCGIAIK
jgi:hypothetical protein|tara:strand:+ start:2559 stop:3113 length:555 start_codon:yes stop_codon:yes gene_type:complete